MACISPIRIKNPRGKYVDVPCGKCYGCLKRKRSGWLLRLEHEQRESSGSLFLTLTYAEENLPYYENDRCFDKSHLQKFWKKLRHYSSFRYYAVSEYGGKFGRPHYHVLLFNYQGSQEAIRKCWTHGYVHIGDVTSASINYCAAYVVTKEQQEFEIGDPRRPFMVCSKNPGIGNSYIDKFRRYHKDGKKPHAVRQFGEKVALPRYYSEKIFSKVERQVMSKLFINSIDEDSDPVLSYKDYKKSNPNGNFRKYQEYRVELIQKREEKLVNSLKQVRDGKNF